MALGKGERPVMAAREDDLAQLRALARDERTALETSRARR
jgi:hypothetical protein